MSLIYDLNPDGADMGVFKDRWLEGPTTPDSGWSHNGPTRHSWVTEEARAPWTKSLKLVMPVSNGSTVNRYQLVLNTPNLQIPDGSGVVERWYAYSLKLGSDWKLNECGDGGYWFTSLVSFRFTNNTANGPGCNLDTYPAAGSDNASGSNLTPTATPGRWQNHSNISGTTGIPTGRHIMGDVVKGQWDDWVLHVGWSTSSNGYREEWRNGVSMGRYDGQTVLNYTPPSGSTQNIESRLGCYQGYKISSTRTLYFGHYRAGTTEADVVLPDSPPSGSTVPGTPASFTAVGNSTTGVVTLDWANAVDGITDYWAVRRSDQPDPQSGAWTRLDTDWLTSNATDSPGIGTWFYYVTAVDTGVNPISISLRSAVAQATIKDIVEAPIGRPRIGRKMRLAAGFWANQTVVSAPVPAGTPFLQSFTSTSQATTQLPTGWAVGDLAFLLILDPNTGGTVTVAPTSGASRPWTLLFGPNLDPASDIRGYLYFRVLASGDAAPSWTFSTAVSNVNAMQFLVRGQVTGTTAAALFTGSATNGQSAVASATTSSISVGANNLVVSFIGVDCVTGVARPYFTMSQSGVTKRVDEVGTDTTEIGIATEPVATATTRTHTWGLGSTDNALMYIVSIKPA